MEKVTSKDLSEILPPPNPLMGLAAAFFIGEAVRAMPEEIQ
jgi:hypothetical protein